MKSNDLSDFMLSATRQMEEDYKRIQKRATEDPGTAGDQGEENWATLLRNWLPKTFHIVTKGRILSHEGHASPQVDILVLQPEYPPHLLNTKVYLAGGVLAAFECKVTLKSLHIKQFVLNTIAIKDKAAPRAGSPYKELQSPILFGLLAHSHSWKGPTSLPVSNIETALNLNFREFIKTPTLMPDIVCVADTACWAGLKISCMAVYNNKYKQATNRVDGSINKEGKVITTFLKHAENTTSDIITPIGAFISVLIYKLAWEVKTLRSLAHHFDKTELTKTDYGNDQFTKEWPLSIYSEKVRDLITDARVKKNYGSWSKWKIYIR